MYKRDRPVQSSLSRLAVCVRCRYQSGLHRTQYLVVFRLLLDCELRHVCLSVRMEQFFFSLDLTFEIFGKYFEKIRVSSKSDNNNGTLHEDQCIFFIVCRSFLLTMLNVSDKNFI